MVETVSVALSGPSLSYLLFENMKSSFKQEGFLLGEIIQKETSTITDNDQRQLNVSTVIKVNSAMPCPKTCYFKDSVGRVDIEVLKHFLGVLTSKVVAWYTYKPSSSFNLTFRQKLLHKQLAELFSLPIDLFACCLLINESSDNCSTHLFSQNFVRLRGATFESLPLHISNLSDPNNTYKTPQKVSEAFGEILDKLKIDHEKSPGPVIVTKIQEALVHHTKNITEELAMNDHKLFELENEIKDLLKNRLTTIKQNHTAETNSDNAPEISDHVNRASNKKEEAKSPDIRKVRRGSRIKSNTPQSEKIICEINLRSRKKN